MSGLDVSDVMNELDDLATTLEGVTLDRRAAQCRRACKLVDDLRWLIDHGEYYFGVPWREATQADIDAVRETIARVAARRAESPSAAQSEGE